MISSLFARHGRGGVRDLPVRSIAQLGVAREPSSPGDLNQIPSFEFEKILIPLDLTQSMIPVPL